jgi:hypothetical protein
VWGAGAPAAAVAVRTGTPPVSGGCSPRATSRVHAAAPARVPPRTSPSCTTSHHSPPTRCTSVGTPPHASGCLYERLAGRWTQRTPHAHPDTSRHAVRLPPVAPEDRWDARVAAGAVQLAWLGGAVIITGVRIAGGHPCCVVVRRLSPCGRWNWLAARGRVGGWCGWRALGLGMPPGWARQCDDEGGSV